MTYTYFINKALILKMAKKWGRSAVFLIFEMIYVIKREEDDNIWIGSFLPMSVGKEEEDSDSLPILYSFPWSLSAALPCLRWFILDPGKEDGVYVPSVLDYLETIKELPEPPMEELRREYSWADKERVFNESLQELAEIGVIEKVDVKELQKGLYKTDFLSQLYRTYPAEIVDLTLSWENLSSDIKGAVREIYKTKNSDKQKELVEKYRIDKRYLPVSLKIDLAGKKNILPEYRNSEKIYTETVIDPIMKIVEKIQPGDQYTFTELEEMFKEAPEKNIKIQDLYQYFEITRNPRKGIYTFTRRIL